MSKKFSFMKIVAQVLNLSGDEEQASELSLPEMLQELYGEMQQAEQSVALSMAQVGQKRMRLKSVLQEHDALMAQAQELERRSQSDLAKAAVAQAVALKGEIGSLSEQVEQLDQQAQLEIVQFRDLEKTADRLKGQIQKAEAMDRFNKIRERVGVLNDGFQEGLVNRIEARVEKIELQTGTITAKAALRSEKLQAAATQQQIDSVLRDAEVDEAYASLKQSVSSEETETLEQPELQALPDPADRARKLLENPAFGNMIKKT